MSDLHAANLGWPASPAAGRLPSDPYYKVTRQAEMAASARSAASSIDKHDLWSAVDHQRHLLDGKAVDQAGEIVAKPLAMVDKVEEPLRFIEIANRLVRAAVGTGTTVKPRQLRPSAPPSIPSHYERVIQRPPLFTPSIRPARAKPVLEPVPNPHPPVLDAIVLTQQKEAETWLAVTVPEAKVELTLAVKRLKEAEDAVGAEQSALLAQGLNSIRRAVKMLADFVYPAEDEPVSDRFDQLRKSDDASYISRIGLALQAAKDSSGRFELDKAELDLFHQRLTRLVERFGKGIHSEGDFGECQMLHVDTWRVVACAYHYGPRLHSAV